MANITKVNEILNNFKTNDAGIKLNIPNNVEILQPCIDKYLYNPYKLLNGNKSVP